MYITIENEVPITEQITFQEDEIDKMRNQLLNPTLSGLDQKLIRDSINRHRLELNKLLRS